MMIFPTIHLNGTSKDSLKNQNFDVYRKVQDAYQALQQAAPHKRDYYPQGEDAWKQAWGEHLTRLGKLLEVKKDLEAFGDYFQR